MYLPPEIYNQLLPYIKTFYYDTDGCQANRSVDNTGSDLAQSLGIWPLNRHKITSIKIPKQNSALNVLFLYLLSR